MSKERVRQINLRDKYLITEHKHVKTYKVKQTPKCSYCIVIEKDLIERRIINV